MLLLHVTLLLCCVLFDSYVGLSASCISVSVRLVLAALKCARERLKWFEYVTGKSLCCLRALCCLLCCVIFHVLLGVRLRGLLIFSPVFVRTLAHNHFCGATASWHRTVIYSLYQVRFFAAVFHLIAQQDARLPLLVNMVASFWTSFSYPFDKLRHESLFLPFFYYSVFSIPFPSRCQLWKNNTTQPGSAHT